MKRGTLRVREVLPIFTQIARGLEAARERGILHRDLKPSNIMIGERGIATTRNIGLAASVAQKVGELPPDATGISDRANAA